MRLNNRHSLVLHDQDVVIFSIDFQPWCFFVHKRKNTR